ncbi:tRNA1(Val) (adenine(37)-N6)-methyltransferase [Chengkuizengella axinellae]|uniref:tRNA1(Val) (Adenine(37)-N6)-methyltransferase n=1 Tax=Chengkuizengella axinellae TaxID=3064388 RepID=A0ABT9J5P3_9BACL|nr:tRNA1(Val) (adenine(37)-N6)-methyltransferase [Chengkuizengella sp. 2205SS18-9]MDP5276931.1 tRNA1(Val) (adenine(37)-N6)-methyltransferase [Chengkuizengella sp. 2205SS18-9]
MEKNISLMERERIDDLLTKELKIIQSDEVFSFSMDAVLLGRFCSVPTKGRILDLCSGNGVIPLLLSTRTRAQITAVEIQEKLADMAIRNMDMNHLTDQISVIRGDLKQMHLQLGYGKFDLITVNPPYLPAQTGKQNINQHIAIARHEICCTLEDVISACNKLVKSGGKVALVHRASRLADIIVLMRQYNIEPKRIRFVHPRISEEANMVLVEGIRNGKADMHILKPLIVYNDRNEYCKELMEIYYGDV